MMQSPTEILLSEVDAFLKRTGTSPSAFGSKAVGDPNLVRNLRAGREPRFSTVQKVKEFIVQAQKEGVE